MQRVSGAGVLGLAILMWSGFAPVGGPVLAGAERPDLTGVWELNREASDEPQPLMSGRNTPRSGGVTWGGGVAGRGPGGIGTGGFGVNRPNPDEVARVREAMRLATDVPVRLTIVAQGKGFVLTDQDGRSQTLTADGRKVKSDAGVLKVETKAKWDGSTLVVERKFEGDVKVLEHYSIIDNPRQLVIRSTVTNDRSSADSVKMRRVYEPA